MITSRTAPILAALLFALPAAGFAQDKVLATVNGKAITEADLRFAEAEVGSEIGNLPDAAKRRVLVEYLIEVQLFADTAESDKLAQGEAFDARMQYWRRRALRDTFFDKAIKNAVDETEARKFYDAQVAQMKNEPEIKASHILVESEEKAREIFEKIAYGADFAKMARENSKDPGSKDQGGALGYFVRGQMVKEFEDAAFKLEKGDVSQPVETKYGWHLIKVEDKRDRKPPTFESVKDRLLGSMIHRKAQEIGVALRGKAKIEYVDPELKKLADTEKKK
ncbi:MAG: peptidylprolyl isomerase [Hyphomicrobiaceae bacterium]